MNDEVLTKQSEAIVSKLQRDGHILNKQEVERVRKALSLVDSMGMMGRFVIFLGGVAGAVTAFMTFSPWGGR